MAVNNFDSLPGGPVPEWQLYEVKAKQTNKGLVETGVKAPDGAYFHFTNGESIQFLRNGTSRRALISLASGNTVPFDAWRASRRDEIKAAFEKANPKFGELYIQVLADFPEMEQMEVHTGTKDQHPTLEYTAGFWQIPKDRNGNPGIVVELSSGPQHYARLLMDRELSAREAAKSLGVDFDILRRDPEILGMFVLLHEMGHVHDYIRNYQRSPQNNDPSYNPIKANEDQRLKEMQSLPVPEASPVVVRQMSDKGELHSYYAKYEQYYKQIGINSPRELLQKQEEKYKTLPSEVYADRFAAQVLKKNWDKLGLGSSKKGTIPT